MSAQQFPKWLVGSGAVNEHVYVVRTRNPFMVAYVDMQAGDDGVCLHYWPAGVLDGMPPGKEAKIMRGAIQVQADYLEDAPVAESWVNAAVDPPVLMLLDSANCTWVLNTKWRLLWCLPDRGGIFLRGVLRPPLSCSALTPELVAALTEEAESFAVEQALEDADDLWDCDDGEDDGDWPEEWED